MKHHMFIFFCCRRGLFSLSFSSRSFELQSSDWVILIFFLLRNLPLTDLETKWNVSSMLLFTWSNFLRAFQNNEVFSYWIQLQIRFVWQISFFFRVEPDAMKERGNHNPIEIQNGTIKRQVNIITKERKETEREIKRQKKARKRKTLKQTREKREREQREKKEICTCLHEQITSLDNQQTHPNVSFLFCSQWDNCRVLVHKHLCLILLVCSFDLNRKSRIRLKEKVIWLTDQLIPNNDRKKSKSLLSNSSSPTESSK